MPDNEAISDFTPHKFINMLKISNHGVTLLPSDILEFRQRSEDEARDTFKMLKSQLIGDSFAYLYSDWAVLEDLAGEEARSDLSHE